MFLIVYKYFKYCSIHRRHSVSLNWTDLSTETVKIVKEKRNYKEYHDKVYIYQNLDVSRLRPYVFVKFVYLNLYTWDPLGDPFLGIDLMNSCRQFTFVLGSVTPLGIRRVIPLRVISSRDFRPGTAKMTLECLVRPSDNRSDPRKRVTDSVRWLTLSPMPFLSFSPTAH